MGESLNKKLQELMSDKALQAKVNKALEMMKKEDIQALEKKMETIDKDDLMKKLNSIDEEKIKELKIDKSDLKGKLSKKEIDKLEKVIGKDSKEMMKKVNDFLKS